MLHCHGPDQKQCWTAPFLRGLLSSPLHGNTNRVPEQLGALFQDTDKTPCARDELSLQRDISWLLRRIRQRICDIFTKKYTDVSCRDVLAMKKGES